MRYCFTLDLIDKPELIASYKKYHQAVWPEILDGIKSVGITNMEIYLLGNRLFMIMDTISTFDIDLDMKKLSNLPRQQEWEEFMWQFQQSISSVSKGEKWAEMEQIFKLS